MSDMKYGSINGLNKPVSRIVHGTIMLSSGKKEQSFKLLDDIFALGVNTFDTAAIYENDGEAVLIEWVAERQLHNKVVIISKCAHPNKWRKRVTPFDIQYDIADCLSKPGADYIDIYMLHRDDPTQEVGPIIETLNMLQEEKKIITFGASNWEWNRVQQANEYAYKKGLNSFTSISPHFSLGEQVGNPWGEGCVTLTGKNNGEAREYYLKNNMPVFSYSTLCRGFFSGLFSYDETAKADKILDEPAKIGYKHDCNFERLKRVQELAIQLGTTVPCLALAWAINSGLNIFTLIGAENKEIMKENIKAFNIKLTNNEIKWLNLELDKK